MALMHRRNTKAAKINADRVIAIRADYANGMTQGDLARREGLSIGQIGRIVRRESWQGLEPSGDEAAASLKRLQEIIGDSVARQPEVMLKELEQTSVDPLKPEVSESLKEKMKGYGIGED